MNSKVIEKLEKLGNRWTKEGKRNIDRIYFNLNDITDISVKPFVKCYFDFADEKMHISGERSVRMTEQLGYYADDFLAKVIADVNAEQAEQQDEVKTSDDNATGINLDNARDFLDSDNGQQLIKTTIAKNTFIGMMLNINNYSHLSVPVELTTVHDIICHGYNITCQYKREFYGTCTYIIAISKNGINICEASNISSSATDTIPTLEILEKIICSTEIDDSHKIELQHAILRNFAPEDMLFTINGITKDTEINFIKTNY